MSHLLPNLLALVTAAAGWFYLFYSRAAVRLSAVEPGQANATRVWLRRAGGVTLFLLAIAFFAGFNTVDAHDTPRAFVTVWLAVLLLLSTAVGLALADVRLTHKLRRRERRS